MMGVIRMLCALFLLYMKLPRDLELLWQLLCNFFRLLIPNWVLEHFVSHLVFGLAVWHIAISYQFSVFLNKLFSLVAIISIGYFWSISLVIIPDVIFGLHIRVIRWFWWIWSFCLSDCFWSDGICWANFGVIRRVWLMFILFISFEVNSQSLLFGDYIGLPIFASYLFLGLKLIYYQFIFAFIFCIDDYFNHSIFVSFLFFGLDMGLLQFKIDRKFHKNMSANDKVGIILC